MVTIRNIYRKDHSLFPIFIIYSIFSNRNQISLSSNKVYDNLITMTRKKGRVPMLVGALQPFFQLTELNIKANPPCFARARAHVRVRVLMTQKSCAVEMRNAILRNYLKEARKGFSLLQCVTYAADTGQRYILVAHAHRTLRK